MGDDNPLFGHSFQKKKRISTSWLKQTEDLDNNALTVPRYGNNGAIFALLYHRIDTAVLKSVFIQQ